VVSFLRLCYPELVSRVNDLKEGTAMPAAVRIKPGKYGSAIGLLLERGGAFQTRHERTLIVNSAQRKALEKADLVETNGSKVTSGKQHGHKTDGGWLACIAGGRSSRKEE
jgi:hypothetical protein